MARVKMVTRTVSMTICEVMLVDVTSATVSNGEVKLSGTYDTTGNALKAIKKLYETDTIKYVTVTSMRNEEVLYGMTEEEFIMYANVLPPRKTYDTEEAEAE